jgi:PAS domain S-box-containing protein
MEFSVMIQDPSDSSVFGEWWRVTLASIGDAIIATNINGKIVFMNPIAELLTGWTREEAVGRPLEEVFVIVNEETRARMSAPVEKVLQTGFVVGLANHTVLIRRDGRDTPIDDSAAPIRDDRGQLLGVVLIFRDITQRRGTEVAQAYLAAIVESSDDAIIGKTLDGVITSWNKGAEKIFGYMAEEAIGRPITMLIPTDHHFEEEKILARLRSGERIDHYITTRIRKDRTPITISLSVSPIKTASGRIIGASKIARDITEAQRAAEALKQSEKLFHLLADSAPVMVWISGTDQQCTFFNKPWLDFTGRTMEQEVGDGWAQGVHRDDLDECLTTYVSAFDARKEFEMEYRLRRHDGQYRWVLDKGTPLFAGERSSFTGYIGSCIDITERKDAEEALRVAEEQLRHVTDNMAAAVTRCSRDLRYEWVSPVYANWLRRDPQQIVGRPIVDVIGADGFNTIRPHVDRVLAGHKEEYAAFVNFEGPGRCWIQATYVPTRDRDGAVNGWVAVVTDITERRRLEQEREQLLDAEQKARAQAEEVSRLKDEFLATVSHELRTPLNAILGWATLIRAGGLSDQQSVQAVETIERNAKNQAQLIEDLLDVSRVITGKFRLDVRPVMLASVVESTINSVLPAAEAKGIRLQTALDPNAGPVSGDASRLQQVVWNLLSNAIKFTPRNGKVQVRVERINSHIEIIVSDTGQGIKPEFLPHVFDPFRQADAGTARQHSGLGLGLAIVRHLVELHGGRVTAESSGDGKGATFIVRLPMRILHKEDESDERVHPTAPTQARVIVGERPNLSGVKVLLIDDELDTRILLRSVLEQCNADVRDAGTAEDGLQIAREWGPSIVVSDIGMPGDDGYDFIRRFRESEAERSARTPAVALTAYARAEDRVRALTAGYQVHIAKPIDPLEFALVIAGQASRGR